MRFIILILALLLPTLAQASFFVTCDVEVTVIRLDGDNAVIKVTTVGKGEGHTEKCPLEHNSEHIALIQGASDIEPGQSLKLDYEYYNAMGPEGFVEGHIWKLPQ